ncbi:hypothetical protein HMPREF3176_00770 [Dermabacter sp. HMSC08H10]|nr:hypothetical protein HMPREF3176_00770 [Dermabacter sp. HMSC08H10]
MWGIDTKAADIEFFSGTTLFENIATDAEGAVWTINKVRAEMEKRAQSMKVNYDNKETGTNCKPTRKTPWNFLIIDELFSAKKDLLELGKPGKSAWNNLLQIAAKGRALGFYIVAASQFADKNNIDDLRANIVNWIILRQDNAYFNDLFLGEGARENGYDSTLIPRSTPSNGYKYSGIGFVREETGTPKKIRFAYLSEDDLFEFAKQYRKENDAYSELASDYDLDDWEE